MDTTSLGTTLVLRSLSFDMYKKACTFSTWEVTNVLHFVSFNEPLELWLHTGKERISVAEDQHKRSANGPADADEIQTKKRSVIPCENVCLFHSGKQMAVAGVHK